MESSGGKPRNKPGYPNPTSLSIASNLGSVRRLRAY